MRSDFVRALLCVAAIVGAAALGGAKAADPARVSQSELDNHLKKEVLRLRAHFDSVDTELRARDVSGLTTAQFSSRMRLTSWLREYRDAGLFPINDRFPGRYVPFFRDSKGTLCAMAYLIDRSGRGDIVERIARSRNNGFIPELADDPALIAWLDSAGLSVSEAARIQPAYDGISPEGAENRLSSDFALATLALGGGSIGAAAVNVVSPSLVSEVAGLLLGGAAVINGAAHLDQNRGTKRVGYASIIAGSVSLASSAGAFIRSRTRSTPRPSSQSRVTIAPAILPTPSSYRLGLAGTASF